MDIFKSNSQNVKTGIISKLLQSASFKFHHNRLRGFRDAGDRNLPFPITLAVGLYNSLNCCISAIYTLLASRNFPMGAG